MSGGSGAAKAPGAVAGRNGGAQTQLVAQSKENRSDEPPPYSVALTDTLRETIQVERAEIATGESALTILQRLIEDNRAALKESEEKIRRLNDELESSKQNPDASGAGAETQILTFTSRSGTITCTLPDSSVGRAADSGSAGLRFEP